MRAPRRFVHDGLPLDVDAATSDTAWLSEFFGATYSSRGDGDAEVTIGFECATSVPDRWPASSRIAFALESGPVRLPARAVGRGVHLLESETRVLYRVPGAGRTAIAYAGSRAAARVRLMRVVREYAHNNSIRTGGVMLHAAAVATGGVAVAIAGAKGSGKTTLALRLLSASGTSFLSNDRLLVRGPEPVWATGVPSVLSIRDGTLALLPALADRLSHTGDFRDAVAERRPKAQAPIKHDALAPVRTDAGIRVSSAQLCAALERPAIGSAPLGAVLFPATNRRQRTTCRPLSPSAAAAALTGALLGHRAGTYASHVFVASRRRAPRAADLHARCRALAGAVPCFRVSLADEETPEDVAAWLARCTRGAW